MSLRTVPQELTAGSLGERGGHYRERHSGYDVGLKPVGEGSIPSFLMLILG